MPFRCIISLLLQPCVGIDRSTAIPLIVACTSPNPSCSKNNSKTMNTTLPEVTSGTALLVSTPLLLAAQLWSWHPLWAAGIWTVYGIGALIPPIQPQLKPMTETPFYVKYNSQHLVCPTPSITITTTALDDSTIMTMASLHASTSSITTKIPSTVPALGVTNFEGWSHLSRINLVTPSVQPSRYARISAPQSPIRSPELSMPQIILPAAVSSSSIKVLSPSFVSGLELTAISRGERSTASPTPSLVLHKLTDYLQSVSVWRLLIKDWQALGFALFLVACVVISVFRASQWLWRHAKVGSHQIWNARGGSDILQCVRRMAMHGVQRTVNVPHVNHTMNCVATTARTVWLWSPFVRVLAAIGVFVFFTVPAHSLDWSFATWVFGLIGLSPVENTYMAAAVKSVSMALIQITSPVTYLVFWPKEAVSAMKSCSAAAWDNPIGPEGDYMSAIQSGPTALICSDVETYVMSYKALRKAMRPFITTVLSPSDPNRLFLVCLPLASMVTGAACPVWAHVLNHFFVITLLTTLFALSRFACAKWPVVQQLSWVLLADRFAVKMLLVCCPLILLLQFLMVTQSYNTMALTVVASTYGVVQVCKESVVPKWQMVLDKLGIAPS